MLSAFEKPSPSSRLARHVAARNGARRVNFRFLHMHAVNMKLMKGNEGHAAVQDKDQKYTSDKKKVQL